MVALPNAFGPTENEAGSGWWRKKFHDSFIHILYFKTNQVLFQTYLALRKFMLPVECWWKKKSGINFQWVYIHRKKLNIQKTNEDFSSLSLDV